MEMYWSFITVLLVCVANAHMVCHPPFGCFTTLPPYNRWSGLPSSPKVLQTRLIFKSNRFNLSSCVVPIIKGFDHSSINGSCFQDNQETKVIIHGAFESSSEDWVKKLASKYLQNNNSHNVIIVDWSNGAMNAFQLSSSSRLVSSQLAYVLINLIKTSKVKAENIHVIGFSTGVMIAGQLGARLKINGQLIRRITGLDPPKPRFLLLSVNPDRSNPIYREIGLDSDDASFVDVIHTDIRFIGMGNPIGHVDFYPNGGKDQPGCSVFSFFRGKLACNHFKAFKYFIESVDKPCRYPSFICKSSALKACQFISNSNMFMGSQADKSWNRNKHSIYYVNTLSKKNYNTSNCHL